MDFGVSNLILGNLEGNEVFCDLLHILYLFVAQMRTFGDT